MYNNYWSVSVSNQILMLVSVKKSTKNVKCIFLYHLLSQLGNFITMHGNNITTTHLFSPQNTGIIVTLTIFSSCVCCVSYVGLCCGLPSWAKILGTIGVAIVVITFSIFIAWLGGGVYLVIKFNKVALFSSVCRNLLVYVVLLFVYVVTVCLVGVVWCVWRVRERRRRERTTTKQRLDTTPKLLRV